MLIDGSMIMSGFVSKVINEIVDIPGNPIKNAIKKADKDRKAKNQNIETRIYQVIIDAIKEFTKGIFKSEDTLYDAAEMIINAFRAKKENIEAVKAGLKMLESPISDDRCADFLRILCDEICRDENDILYKEIDLFQNEQTLREIRKGFGENTHNQGMALEILDDVREDTKYIRETLDNNKVNKAEYHSEIPVQNRAEEYASKWDKNVFLNDFNKRDKNAGVNVKLKDIYLEEQLPHYTWKTNNEQLSDLKELLREYTIDNDGKNMLLILGQPGIGKSTLITWMMANFKEKKDDFLVYQFASDLKNVNWQSDTIFEEILKTLNLICSEMEGKILILDGFDEINTNSDRERILNRINQKLTGMNNLKNFSVVITCRENYVYELRKLECDFITLQAWDDDQIRCFCESYRKKSGSDIPTSKIDKLLENKEVFGIPIILYMVLALEITVEKSESLVDVYDQIFSIDRSSIYDRCIKDSRYGAEHRISEEKIKQSIHQISQRIAFWIFENNSEKAFISRDEFKEICVNESKYIQSDVLIGNYFKLIRHCEGVGTEEFQFVHRSIYEYFVAVYFFECIHNLRTREAVAGKLGELLKKGHLSKNILEFIKYKFDDMKEYNLPDLTKEIFNIMLRNGMTYYIKEKYKNIFLKERIIFSNLLEIIHLWNDKLGKLDKNIKLYIICGYWGDLNLSGVDLSEEFLSRAYLYKGNLSGADLHEGDLSEAFLYYADLHEANLCKGNLHNANIEKANLSGANLRGAVLSGAKLYETNLSGADLSGADLGWAGLYEANLRGANLKEACLIGASFKFADLSGANLSGADLTKTIFDERQVIQLRREYDLSNSKIFILETKEIISYKDYAHRK